MLRPLALFLIFHFFGCSGFAQIFNRDSSKFKNFLQIGVNGSRVSIPPNSIWSTQDNFSIEILARFNTPLNPTGGAIFINTVGPSANSDWGWGFVAISNRFGFHACSPQPTQNMANQIDTISGCRWYHLAGVKEGNILRFYLDGVLKATASFPSGQSIRSSTGPAQFGYHRPPFNNWFNGNVDEFRLWNFARTQAQIQATMNDTLLGNETGLQVYYKFNEVGQGNGVIIKNSAQVSGAALNGTSISQNANFPNFTNSEILPIPPPPLVPTQTELCFPGGIFNLNVNAPTGVNVYQYNWFNGFPPDSVFIPGATGNFYVTPAINQTDTFFVSLVDRNKCESIKVPVVANVRPIPVIQFFQSLNSFCDSATITLTAQVVGNEIGTYTWWRGYSGNQLLSPQPTGNNLVLMNLKKSDTIWVSFTSKYNCTSTKLFKIATKLAKPIPPAIPSPIHICSGESGSFSVSGTGNQIIRLYADSALFQQIGQGSLNEQISTPELIESRNFWVTISDTNDLCKSLGRKLEVIVHRLPVISISPSLNSFCDSANIIFTTQLNNPENGTYSWWRGFLGTELINLQPSESTLTIANLKKSDTIWVTFTSQYNCLGNKTSTSVKRMAGTPNVSILFDDSICPDSKTYFYSPDITTGLTELYYDISLSQLIASGFLNDSLFTPSITTNSFFWLKLSGSDSTCESSQGPFLVNLKDCSKPLSFPNLISVNQDNKNDVFEIKNLEFHPPAEIQIFNRWGKQVFQSSHYQNDWAGEEGIYFYSFKSSLLSKNGWILVMK